MNRKERRAKMAEERKKKPGKIVTPEHLSGRPSAEEVTALKQQQMKQQQQKMERLEQRVQAMLDGKEAVPNEVVGYLVEELKEATNEKSAVSRNIQQYEQVLNQNRRRLVELNGIGQKFFQDIVKRIDETQPAPPVKAKPKLVEPTLEEAVEDASEPDPEPVI
jgi:type IV secretory pathway VirB4 component